MKRFKNDYIAPADRKALHNAVREEAGNRCIRCGHPQGDFQIITPNDGRVAEVMEAHPDATVVPHHFDATGGDGWRVVVSRCDEHCTHGGDTKLRILTVHHLDGDKAHNVWWNLLALCQVCHLQIQGKVIPEQPYLWPHTPWFIPFVCGFYAHYYGKLEITRAEADEDPNRWLQLGQPWLYERESA